MIPKLKLYTFSWIGNGKSGFIYILERNILRNVIPLATLNNIYWSMIIVIRFEMQNVLFRFGKCWGNGLFGNLETTCLFSIFIHEIYDIKRLCWSRYMCIDSDVFGKTFAKVSFWLFIQLLKYCVNEKFFHWNFNIFRYLSISAEALSCKCTHKVYINWFFFILHPTIYTKITFFISIYIILFIVVVWVTVINHVIPTIRGIVPFFF